MLKYQILGINDYPPWVWGPDQRRWVAEYLDACARYFSEKLSVEISFIFECAETSAPRERVQGGYVSTSSTLRPLAETAKEGGFNGIVVLSRHRGDWQIVTAAGADSASDPERGWAYVRYDPPVVTAPRFIYKYLVILSHEWLHLILQDLQGPVKTWFIDRPPFRDIYTIAEFLVDGIFPVQSLEEIDVFYTNIP